MITPQSLEGYRAEKKKRAWHTFAKALRILEKIDQKAARDIANLASQHGFKIEDYTIEKER